MPARQDNCILLSAHVSLCLAHLLDFQLEPIVHQKETGALRGPFPLSKALGPQATGSLIIACRNRRYNI